MCHRSDRPTKADASRVATPPLYKLRHAVPRIVTASLAALVMGWVAVLDASAASAGSDLAPTLIVRRGPAKPAATALAPGTDASRVYVKFAEGSGIRLRNGRLVSPTGAGVAGVESVLRDAGIRGSQVARLFSRAEGDLDRERQSAEKHRGRQLADLNLYFEIAVPADVSIEALCDALNALPSVELAAPAPLPQQLPSDIAPSTPNYVTAQGYRAAAPEGVGASQVAGIAGADGTGIAIVDIEYQWVLEHEDLELDASANIDPAPIYDPYPQDQGNHGTAVLEILGGRPNAYGVTGLVPEATLRVAPAMTTPYGYNVARAVNLAAQSLEPGDVIVVEQQGSVCGGSAYGPVEGNLAVFDAISIATASGIAVVEAAGNGSVDLDAPACAGLFDRSVRDSGAIIVGAGDPGSRTRLSFSTHGSRVDLQGWGASVATAGYGALFDPGDVRQRYTGYFSGTSSATPIVAAAVAAVQGARVAHGMAPLTPEEIRDLLASTGSIQPQIDAAATPIGPLPNIPGALEALPEPLSLPGLGAGCALIVWLSRRRNDE